jgi:signal transduction histidine kinase/ActR/RegA family two-component response regulator
VPAFPLLRSASEAGVPRWRSGADAAKMAIAMGAIDFFQRLRPRGLARKHALVWSLVVSGLLLASGVVATSFAFVQTVRDAEALQREKALAAAERIGTFVAGIEQPMRWLVTDRLLAEADGEALRIELAKLLRRVPALSELVWLDAQGRERAAVARMGLDRVDSGTDRSAEAGFRGASERGSYVGTVSFRRASEPYLQMALAARRGGPVLAAEVNLRSVWSIVSQVRHGQTGLAYVVDASGELIAHPDLSLVLGRTSLAVLPHVRRALASDQPSADAGARDLGGVAVLSAAAPIPRLGWTVFVEQQRNEALAPVWRAVAQSAALVVVGLVLAVVASVALAHRLARPIQTFNSRVVAVGAGQLGERIELDTGDELQDLAEQFNRMASNLQSTYATLEARVAERTRELARANEAKSRFLAAASHDLRQPVHALGLFVGQLRQAKGAEQQRALIAQVEASTAAFEALLEALLDNSRLDAGKVPVRREPVALAPLLERVAAGSAAAAAAKGIRLRVRAADAWADSDPVLLERIVLNLVSNAVRYTRDGGVLLGCRRRGQVLHIVVADTGIGIPAEELPEIFREFYRGPAVAEHRADGGAGLGLGLAIVERLARLLDHRLDVRSRLGQGTCFTLELPRVAAPAGPAPPPADTGAVRLEGRRVLVIDDDAAVREAMRLQLAAWGITAWLAADAAQALAIVARDGSPDAVLADLRLAGGASGIEAAQAVRAACGAAPAVAVITGETDSAHLAAARDAGHPVLIKPLRPAKLRALLEALLGGRSAPGAGAHREPA